MYKTLPYSFLDSYIHTIRRVLRRDFTCIHMNDQFFSASKNEIMLSLLYVLLCSSSSLLRSYSLLLTFARYGSSTVVVPCSLTPASSFFFRPANVPQGGLKTMKNYEILFLENENKCSNFLDSKFIISNLNFRPFWENSILNLSKCELLSLNTLYL